MKKAIMNISYVYLTFCSALVNKDIRYFLNVLFILLMHQYCLSELFFLANHPFNMQVLVNLCLLLVVLATLVTVLLLFVVHFLYPY